jgi:hypothetical protein
LVGTPMKTARLWTGTVLAQHMVRPPLTDSAWPVM